MSAGTDAWSTTISTLLFAFRNALVAILPYMDAVRIAWRDGEAYDDWDDIASTLYRNMVEKSIQHASECLVETKLAPYDLLVPSYNQYTYISVTINDQENLAFVGFSTKEEPFNYVKCVAIHQNQDSETEVLYFPIKECQFSVVLHDESDGKDRITDLNVEI